MPRRSEAMIVEREARIEACKSLMRADRWSPEAKEKLQLEWGVSHQTMSLIAVEASRCVRREIARHTDPAEVTELLSQRLARGVAEASDKGDWRSLARLADVWSRIVGARAPERVAVSDDLAGYTRASREEQIAWLDRTIAQLERERQRLLSLSSISA